MFLEACELDHVVHRHTVVQSGEFHFTQIMIILLQMNFPSSFKVIQMGNELQPRVLEGIKKLSSVLKYGAFQ